MSEELHPSESITTLYLVRHGHTKATEMGLLYSDPQMEITEKGAKQAQAAASYVAEQKPQLLVRGNAVRVAQLKAIEAKQPVHAWAPFIHFGVE